MSDVDRAHSSASEWPPSAHASAIPVITTVGDPAPLTAPARRVLAHVRGRTISGRFACPIWNMPAEVWRAALAELADADYRIEWTLGTVADDPTVTGGYILRDHAHTEAASCAEEASR